MPTLGINFFECGQSQEKHGNMETFSLVPFSVFIVFELHHFDFDIRLNFPHANNRLRNNICDSTVGQKRLFQNRHSNSRRMTSCFNRWHYFLNKKRLCLFALFAAILLLEKMFL